VAVAQVVQAVATVNFYRALVNHLVLYYFIHQRSKQSEKKKEKGLDIKLLSYTDYVVRDNIESYKGNGMRNLETITLYMQNLVQVGVNLSLH
jgi:hypothetical protein